MIRADCLHAVLPFVVSPTALAAAQGGGSANVSMRVWRVDNLGPEARCIQCHQGRESTVSMNTMLAASGLADDAVATGSVPSGQTGAAGKLSFRNVHYLAAGATLYGRMAEGGYQYAGKIYNGKLELKVASASNLHVIEAE